jgi:hypothetical protein
MHYRTFAVAGVILLACSIAPAQESATLSGGAIVKAGESVAFTVRLNQAPNFDGGQVMYTISGPGWSIQSSVATKQGETVYQFSVPIPVDASGGTYSVSKLSFYAGTRTTDLAINQLSFQVVPNTGLIFPTGAEVAVNPSQTQLLRTEALRLQMQVQSLKASLTGAAGNRVPNILRQNVQAALDSLRRTETMFRELGNSNPQPAVASSQAFFEDIRISYNEVLTALRNQARLEVAAPLKLAALRKEPAQNRPLATQYPPLAQVAFRAFEQNELAYKIVADTQSLTFDLEVGSTPPGAMVSYHRRGDPYQHNPDPTNTVIKALPYAIWAVQFQITGYRTEEREHDPFREPNHVIHVDLKK